MVFQAGDAIDFVSKLRALLEVRDYTKLSESIHIRSKGLRLKRSVKKYLNVYKKEETFQNSTKEDQNNLFCKIINGIKSYGFKEIPFATYKFLKGFNFFSGSKDIRAYWHEAYGIKNFGDMITPYLIHKMTGKKATFADSHSIKEHYIGVGSVLKKSNNNAVIWGTGLMHKKNIIDKPKKILAIRGPITRDKLLSLGYNCPEIYGDPGILLPLFYNPVIKKDYKIGFIPHYVDYELVCKKYENNPNISVIDLLLPVEDVIDEILKCEKTFSSSLHGVIASHVYGIPSLWVKFQGDIKNTGIKFNDYFLSLNMKEYSPLDFRNVIYSQSEMINIFYDNFEHALPEEGKLTELHEGLLRVCPFYK
jgi:hypothetical protein